MSAPKKPDKPVALANGRVPAELSKMRQSLCGRIPANSEGILINFGGIPNEIERTLIAKPIQTTQPIAQVVNTPLLNVAATGKTAIKSSAQKLAADSARKDSH